MTESRRWLTRAGAIAGVAALASLPLFFDSAKYPLYVAGLIGINAIAALGLNVLTGTTGQISLGQAALMGVGAYTTGALAAHLPFPLVLFVAAAVTGAVGFLLGLPALRLHGHFLALATLGFSVVVPQLALTLDEFTGGHAGLNVGQPTLGSWVLSTESQIYYLVLTSALVLAWLTFHLLQSHIGRAFRMIRETEIAAQAMGVNLALYKTLAFAVSAAYAGVSGSLYAYLVGFISPYDFGLLVSLQLLAMIVVGGMDSIPGSFLGALLLTWVPMRFSRLQGMTLVLEGVAIVAAVMLLPAGLARLGAWLRPPDRGAAQDAGAARPAKGAGDHAAAND